MGDLHATTEAISTYLTDLQNQVRAPSPPLASVLRVLSEPLHFLGFIGASEQGTNQPTDTLPRWSGPGLESGTNQPTTSTRLHFIQHLLPNHLEFILDRITLNWLSALTTSQQSRLFDASFVPSIGSLRHQPSLDYNWACSVAVVSVQTLVGRLNHRSQEDHSFVNQTILRLLRKLLTTYTLRDYHDGAFFLSRSKSNHPKSGSSSAAMSEWTVYWDSFVSKLYSIPTRISNVLGVAGQLGSRSDQGLDPCFQEYIFFERQARQLQHLLESVSTKDKKAKDEEEHVYEPHSCAVVITKFMRLGYGAILVQVVTATLWGVQDSSRAEGWRAALANCAPGVVQLVLSALVEHLQADRLDFGDCINNKLTKKGSAPRSDQILSPKEQLLRVHKAAKMLTDLGFGTSPFGLHQTSTDHGVMVGQVLTQGKVKSMGVLRALVCVQSGWPRDVQATDDSVLFQSFINVVSIWSDALFVKHSSIEYQRYISFQLLLMMGYFHSTTLNDPRLGSQISDGMSNWLDVQSFQQKTIALVIAEEFTKAIGSQANFDLNGSDPDIQFARSLVLLRDGTRIYDPVPDTVPLEQSHGTGDTGSGIDDVDDSTVFDDGDNDEEEDPDAIVQSTRTIADSDSDSDSDDEDEDDLKPYEMEYESEPDEDASSVRKPKVAAPLYLKDLNKYLRASEDREKAEMGLNKAAELIRRKIGSLELEEYAEMLATSLIEIHDTFELDGFFKKREDALVALVVSSPILTCGVLTFQFYEKKNSIGQRLNILTVLGLGARELSGFPTTAATTAATGGRPSPVSTSKPYGTTAVTSVTKKPITFDSITTDITMDRTRKFSQKSEIESRRSQPKANPFANVAPVVLAGLLGRWGGNRGAGKERGYDAMQRAPAMVLKKFVLTLGLIVYYAGNSPQLTLMTRELFRFLLALRYHNPPTTEMPSAGGNRGAPASVADSISAMFDQATTLSAPLTSLKLPEIGSTKIGKSSSLSTLDSAYNYNLDLVEAILFGLLILVTPSASTLSDEILLSEFYPEILEIQNWTMELWDHPQDNQGKARMYCAAVLQRCFELLKMA